MKQYLRLFIIVLFILPDICSAQTASKVVPVEIYWIADGKKIDINQAQSGIRLPEKLEFAVVLTVNQKLKGQKFQFKWYRRGASGDYPLNCFIKKVENIKPGETQITLKVGRSNLKKGWVKVQIEADIDNKLLSFENKQEFWINLL